MIVIVSAQAGFRRAGIAHTAEPAEYPDDFFTKEQLEALKQEPLLTVSHETKPICSLPADPFAEVTALDKAFGCAIGCLDEDKSNVKDWTKSGVPQVTVLTEIMGEDISAAMRDVGWKMAQEGAE